MRNVLDMATKVCTKCGIEKEATTEFFYKLRNKLNNRCKVCCIKYSSEYIKINPLSKEKKHAAYIKSKEKGWRSIWNKSEKKKIQKQKFAKSLKGKEFFIKYKETETYKKCLIVSNMIRDGIPKEVITPELIELKRIIIKTKILCKTLKN